MIAVQHVLKAFLLLAASVIPGHDEPAEFQMIRIDMLVTVIYGDPVTTPTSEWEI